MCVCACLCVCVWGGGHIFTLGRRRAAAPPYHNQSRASSLFTRLIRSERSDTGELVCSVCVCVYVCLYLYLCMLVCVGICASVCCVSVSVYGRADVPVCICLYAYMKYMQNFIH